MKITPLMFDRPDKLRINESVKLTLNVSFILPNTYHCGYFPVPLIGSIFNDISSSLAR